MTFFDSDAIHSNMLIVQKMTVQEFDRETGVLTATFDNKEDEERYYAQLVKLFHESEHHQVEFSARNLLPTCNEKLGAMSRLFDGAIEELKGTDLDKKVAMQVKQAELDQKKEALDKEFHECVQRLKKFSERIPSENIEKCYQRACELNPSSFLPHKYVLFINFMTAGDENEFLSYCEGIYQKFPLDTFLTLLTLVEMRLGMLTRDYPLFSFRLNLAVNTLNFLLGHHPEDQKLQILASHFVNKFPEVQLTVQENKNLFEELYAKGLEAWLQGDTEAAKDAWIEAKKYNYTDFRLYILLCLYHSSREDRKQAQKLLTKGVQLFNMGSLKTRHASFEFEKEFTPATPPPFIFLKNFLELDPLQFIEETFVEFFLTDEELVLLIMRHILDKLCSLELPVEKMKLLAVQYTALLHHLLTQENKPFFGENLLTFEDGGVIPAPEFLIEVPKSSPFMEQLYLEGFSHYNYLYLSEDQIVTFTVEQAIVGDDHKINYNLVIPLLLLLQKRGRWSGLLNALKSLLPHLPGATEPVKSEIARILYGWAQDHVTYRSDNDIHLAAEVFQALASQLFSTNARFQKHAQFAAVLAGNESEVDGDEKSPLGILTALASGKKINVDTHRLCLQSTEELPFVTTILYLTHVDNDPRILFSAAWPPFAKSFNPLKELMIEMITLGKDLKARSHFLPFFHFPTPHNTFEEVFTQSNLYFGQHYLQPREAQRDMVAQRSCAKLHDPKKKIDFTFDETTMEGPNWSFSLNYPYKETKALYDLLLQSQLDLLDKQREHQESIDNEAPKYTQSAEFIAWVKQDPAVIKAIEKGTEIDKKSLSKYGLQVSSQFLCDLKEKREHHVEIESLKTAQKNFMKANGKNPYYLHYLAASLVASVQEKGGEYNLYFATEEDAFAVFQLLYEYTRHHLIRHYLKSHHLNLKSRITYETLKTVLFEVNTQLAGAFHGPETHVFGHGPRYPHFNAGIFFKGEKPVNTHLYFGKMN